MYWSPVSFPCMVTTSSLQSCEIHPKPLLSLHRKGQLDGCSLGYRLYFCVSRPSSGRRLHEAETALVWPMDLAPCPQTCSSMSVCQQWTFNDSPGLLSRWFKTVSNCSCWHTSIGQSVLFEYGTGCEWHSSNETLQCPVVTIRYYPWSAGSCEVFHIVSLCIFSHQSADYSIVVSIWRPIALEDIPVVCMPIMNILNFE